MVFSRGSKPKLPKLVQPPKAALRGQNLAERRSRGPKLEARGPSSQQADARGLRSSGPCLGVFVAKLCGPRARASSPQVGASGARELATVFFARGPKLELPKLVATDGHS